jgi:hypothetical protein
MRQKANDQLILFQTLHYTLCCLYSHTVRTTQSQWNFKRHSLKKGVIELIADRDPEVTEED